LNQEDPYVAPSEPSALIRIDDNYFKPFFIKAQHLKPTPVVPDNVYEMSEVPLRVGEEHIEELPTITSDTMKSPAPSMYPFTKELHSYQ
jgi:hypothetical protein